MADERFAVCCRFSLKGGQQAERIFASVRLCLLLGNVTNSGVKVCQAGKSIRGLTWLNARWPANNKRNAVTTFVDVRFVPSKSSAWVVIVTE